MAEMTATVAKKTPLRRSFSEHMKVSTNKAWDAFWRSTRERRLWEIEAKEACDWLRAAGFPQYAQVLKDCKFPIDIEFAKRDHQFLDKDALDSLCRRLITLNKSVEMRLDLPKPKHQVDDDFIDEDFCAISPSWTYDRRMRQWRHIDPPMDFLRLSDSSSTPQDMSPCDNRDVRDHHDVCSIHSSSSTESESQNRRHKSHREDAVNQSTTDDQGTSRSSSRCSSSNKTPSLDISFSGPPSPGGVSGGGSSMSLEAEACVTEKPPQKKGTSLLRKMEKLRLRGTTGLLSVPRNPGTLAQRVVRETEGDRRMGRGPSSHASSSPSSPHPMSSSSSNSHSESSSVVSTPSPVTRVRSNCKRCNSASENGKGLPRNNNQNRNTENKDYKDQINNNNNNISHEALLFHIPHGHKPGTFPTSLAHKHNLLSPVIDETSINWRTGSFHGYQSRRSCRRGMASPTTSSPSPSDAGIRLSIYDNVPDDHQLSESEGGSGGSVSDAERMGDDSEVTRLLVGEDVFSALDTVLERINDLQQLVSTWTENLSEDDSQQDSTSASSSSSSTSSCSHDSLAHCSSATSPCPSSPTRIHLEVQHSEEEEESCEKISESRDQSKTRSAQDKSRVSQQLHWSSEQSLPTLPTSPGVENQSVSQFLLLHKLALLKLTALMDKYSPSSKQGWNWTVPKPLRKTKATQAKGRRVFGVPLLVNVQQTGESLPPSILRALVYLRTECLDQVGLFRKSGLKSRIQHLREMLESNPDDVSYNGQSAFDVADMVKQYLRDLPEPIFTSKLCESFLHIYQYFPKDQQLVASQAAIMLLPDENREALRTILFFLRDVVACVEENQMTPTNIAVCLAPSLFHLNALKRDTSAARSSHRKHSLGRPDQRDLSENLAATQGLANMITEAQRLFEIPEFWPAQHLSAAGQTEDLLKEVAGSECPGSGRCEDELEERRQKLQMSTHLLLKETREKSRGWENQTAPEAVTLALKKMDDGCPLWMWRGSVEVEAHQEDLLHRLLREHELWEGGLHQAAIIQTLPKDAEVYRYFLHGQGHGLGSCPPREHLLLRTWQTDPSCGPLYLSSVSIDHPEVPVEGVRVHTHSCLYLLQPIGVRRTRLTHLCRTDERGRSQAWHHKVSGHRLAAGLLAIQDSFRAELKETSA
ncbi:rho GTPase-activating protein 7 isoform X4 [Dunckerocampus dactyliophorus]|uniref:rho GTPase-activating protein 7 isoform X4 n=1 Tax=Dunckerocampus dactyliophorus TaxID=161453 RepID=UPI00240517BE|nr:rho GTPase-activating protein 7 isoform X4 [Dunckerocampus dactyliophorus]